MRCSSCGDRCSFQVWGFPLISNTMTFKSNSTTDLVLELPLMWKVLWHSDPYHVVVSDWLGRQWGDLLWIAIWPRLLLIASIIVELEQAMTSKICCQAFCARANTPMLQCSVGKVLKIKKKPWQFDSLMHKHWNLVQQTFEAVNQHWYRCVQENWRAAGAPQHHLLK